MSANKSPSIDDSWEVIVHTLRGQRDGRQNKMRNGQRQMRGANGEIVAHALIERVTCRHGGIIQNDLDPDVGVIVCTKSLSRHTNIQCLQLVWDHWMLPPLLNRVGSRGCVLALNRAGSRGCVLALNRAGSRGCVLAFLIYWWSLTGGPLAHMSDSLMTISCFHLRCVFHQAMIAGARSY